MHEKSFPIFCDVYILPVFVSEFFLENSCLFFTFFLLKKLGMSTMIDNGYSDDILDLNSSWIKFKNYPLSIIQELSKRWTVFKA